jgi:Tfp pilus assembly PilM family ATPase
MGSDKPCAVVFCFGHHSAITVFYENKLVLYREHPVGYMTLGEAISAKMCIDIAIAQTMMDDPVIDITPVITPLLETLYRQVDISADYLARRKNCIVENFYIYGLPCGVSHWTSTFKTLVNLPIHHLHPFGGISCSNKRILLPESFEKNAPLFMSAIGAARALLEDI